MNNEIKYTLDESGEIIGIDESTPLGKKYASYVRKVTAEKDAEIKTANEHFYAMKNILHTTQHELANKNAEIARLRYDNENLRAHIADLINAQ